MKALRRSLICCVWLLCISAVACLPQSKEEAKRLALKWPRNPASSTPSKIPRKSEVFMPWEVIAENPGMLSENVHGRKRRQPRMQALMRSHSQLLSSQQPGDEFASEYMACNFANESSGDTSSERTEEADYLHLPFFEPLGQLKSMFGYNDNPLPSKKPHMKADVENGGVNYDGVKHQADEEQLRLSTAAWDKKVNDLPETWDWRNVGGRSFVTHTLNQHIPVYCGSCWDFAATSTFGDRLKILRNANTSQPWPEINLSTQYSLNCLTTAGTCNGGSDLELYREFKRSGTVEEGCLAYVAIDEACGDARNQCRNCFGPPGPDAYCFPQKRYKKYYAQSYGFIGHPDLWDALLENSFLSPTEPEGKSDSVSESFSPPPAFSLHALRFDQRRTASMVDQMKVEIFDHGPVSCVVDAEPMFNYTEGIIKGLPGDEINHVISVAGWGREPPALDGSEGDEFWVVRNSWGSYWGEDGWARVKTGENNCFIESFCSFADPQWPPVIVNHVDELFSSPNGASTTATTTMASTIAQKSESVESDPVKPELEAHGSAITAESRTPSTRMPPGAIIHLVE